MVIETIGIAGACKPASAGTVECRRGVTTGGAPRTDAVGRDRAGVLIAGLESTPATLQTREKSHMCVPHYDKL